MSLRGRVLFDVDGVLIDSLPQHLKICKDQADALGLTLTIPDISQFRTLVASGARISPMLHFFETVGFPKWAALQADALYQRDFARNYPSQLFPGVESVLAQLCGTGVELGLLTANVRENVAPVLGHCLRFFKEEHCHYFDPARSGFSKSAVLAVEAARTARLMKPLIYVGDQPSDLRAADEAGAAFLAVTYGWGFAVPPGAVDYAAEVSGITARIFQMMDALTMDAVVHV